MGKRTVLWSSLLLLAAFFLFVPDAVRREAEPGFLEPGSLLEETEQGRRAGVRPGYRRLVSSGGYGGAPVGGREFHRFRG